MVSTLAGNVCLIYSLYTNGYQEAYRTLRTIVQSIRSKRKIMALVELHELYTELDELKEDLRRE